MRNVIFVHFYLEMRSQLVAHLVIESHMEKENGEALQGVENCEDNPGPSEALSEIEEACEPAKPEDGEEGGGALQPGHRLPHHVLLSLRVARSRVSCNAHRQAEDDTVDCHYGRNRPGKCPNKAMVC